MKKFLGFAVVLMVLGTAPMLAYAESASGAKLSLIEFSAVRENHGASERVIEKRYEDYRQGRFAVTSLDTQHMR